MDKENKTPSSSAIPEPQGWKDRYRWLGVLVMAAFAGLAPVPPPPKPPREIAEYAQIAEDPDGPEPDPEFYFLQQALDQDESSMGA